MEEIYQVIGRYFEDAIKNSEDFKIHDILENIKLQYIDMMLNIEDLEDFIQKKYPSDEIFIRKIEFYEKLFHADIYCKYYQILENRSSSYIGMLSFGILYAESFKITLYQTLSDIHKKKHSYAGMNDCNIRIIDSQKTIKKAYLTIVGCCHKDIDMMDALYDFMIDNSVLLK